MRELMVDFVTPRYRNFQVTHCLIALSLFLFPRPFYHCSTVSFPHIRLTSITHAPSCCPWFRLESQTLKSTRVKSTYPPQLGRAEPLLKSLLTRKLLRTLSSRSQQSARQSSSEWRMLRTRWRERSHPKPLHASARSPSPTSRPLARLRRPAPKFW